MADRRIAEAAHFGKLLLTQAPYFAEKLYTESHTLEKSSLSTCILYVSFHFDRYPFLKTRYFLSIMITIISLRLNVVL